LDGEGAAVVRAALDPLARPLSPAAADGPDPRTPGRRRADALVEICRRALAGGDLPDTGGERPQLVVTVPLHVLSRGLRGRTPDDRVGTLGRGTAGSGARDDRPAGPGVSGGVATHDGTGGAGTSRGTVGAGTLDDGTVVSATTARRLACDAAVLPAVLGGAGQVLDVGRSRRLFTGPLRRALVLRDRGCAFPGCDRPPSWCEAHHLRHWAHGGPTSLAKVTPE
jgi:hypothetical protein